jgi:hypothetical protein
MRGTDIPVVTSARPSVAVAAALVLTVVGSGFDGGSVPEVYDAKGRLVASGSVRDQSETRLVASVPLAGAGPGTYAVKVRAADGRRSEGVAMTLGARVEVSPKTGRPGATFTYTGTGFTAGFGAISHMRRPNGLEFPAKRMPVGPDGTFEDVVWTGEFVPGTYTLWAVDDYSKVASPPATLVVVP